MNNKIMSFRPVEKNKRYFETVSTEIKKQIIRGVFKLGDKLPSEAELSEQFNVGRQTIREAMRILELSGFVSIRKGGGGGPIVKNSVLNTVNNLLVDVFQIENINIDEITTVRLEIENVVLQHAIKNVDEKDIEALKKNIFKAKEKIENGEEATKENIQFHVLLASATKNQAFKIVVTTLMAVLGDYHDRIPSDLSVSRRAIQRHEELVEAIIRKKKNIASQILRNHLEEVRDRLNKFGNILENFG